MPVQNGQPDSFFVAEVRRSLRDQPNFVQESPPSDGATGAYSSAASKPFRLQRSPVKRSLVNQPGLDPGIYVTAPAAANQPGFSRILPVFDPPPPITLPSTVPVLSDGGAAGTLAAATYQVMYTYILTGGVLEVGMSPLSNAVAIAANHKLTVAAISGIPSGVATVNYYIATSTAGGSFVGFVGNQAVTANAVPALTFSAGGNGTVIAMVTSDTGELVFPVAPLTGTISVSYQTSRFSDQQIVDALTDGLSLLWPEVWTAQPFDTTSILPSPTQWEYDLPVATYGDPRTVILEVESNPPSAFLIYTRKSDWRFSNDSSTPKLIFAKPPPAGGTVRITYATPYTALSQVPPVAQMLPVYYAIARLMSDQEVMRSRADDLPALTGENAGAEKGGSLQTAAWWLQNMFEPGLKKLSLGYPARRLVMTRAAERLGLGPIWSGMP